MANERETVGLTERQLDIRNFILQFQERHNRVPTYQEIGGALGIASVHTVYRQLQQSESASEGQVASLELQP